MQPDGKYLLAGYAADQFALVRYNKQRRIGLQLWRHSFRRRRSNARFRQRRSGRWPWPCSGWQEFVAGGYARPIAPAISPSSATCPNGDLDSAFGTAGSSPPTSQRRSTRPRSAVLPQKDPLAGFANQRRSVQRHCAGTVPGQQCPVPFHHLRRLSQHCRGPVTDTGQSVADFISGLTISDPDGDPKGHRRYAVR